MQVDSLREISVNSDKVSSLIGNEYYALTHQTLDAPKPSLDHIKITGTIGRGIQYHRVSNPEHIMTDSMQGWHLYKTELEATAFIIAIQKRRLDDLVKIRPDIDNMIAVRKECLWDMIDTLQRMLKD